MRAVRNHPEPVLTLVRSRVRGDRPETRFVRLSQLRRLCACEQVAAVCYRVRSGAIEFLLVRTRSSGRWTFPKGGSEPGLTHAQAAALEAFEEAGVHGRIEEASFTRYVRRKRGTSGRRSGEREPAVNAHLCEVLRLSPPQESNRNRTWFSVEEARRRLREGRESNDGAEFARVVDKAVTRIQRLNGGTGVVADRQQRDHPLQPRSLPDALQKDALQKVRFDFQEAYGRAAEASFMPYISRLRGTQRPAAPAINAHRREVLPCEILEFGPPREKIAKALGTGPKMRMKPSAAV
jgi:8-oxo-dGTP pyrophosphatase MutT (NUDIX family)